MKGNVLAAAEILSVEDGAPTSLASIRDGFGGGVALRLVTESGFTVRMRYDLRRAPCNARFAEELRFSVRALNTNDFGWQGNVPEVTLEDTRGRRRTYLPSNPSLLPTDGTSWRTLRVPLQGGEGWTVTGDAIDQTRIRGIELALDTWGYGYRFDFDALRFVGADTVCEVACLNQCSGHGTCDEDTATCECALGYGSDDCSECALGFVERGNRCRLPNDASYSYWPNPVSTSNSDAWLAVHHAEVSAVRPKLLVLDFVNTRSPAEVSPLVQQVANGFREGSRWHAYENAAAPAQLEYEVLPIRDLRDGVMGRPPAPAGFDHTNSTLYPRRAPGDFGWQQVDYKRFYASDFAQYLGIEDPAVPGRLVDLCTAVERGLVHEMWIVAAHEDTDAVPAEVLEHKQRYTKNGNKIPGSFDACAGNGCFDVDTPHCGASLRIGFVNYDRGPGCYLHSQGHGVERAATGGSVPAWGEWFVPFAGFDLDARYGLPFSNLYGLGCFSGQCITYPSSDAATFDYYGTQYVVDPYDAVCGNVHFPPNAQQHYDTANPTGVSSSCASFGRSVVPGQPPTKSPVSAATWASNASVSWDCGGEFLVWWYQNMPAHGSAQAFDDGRPMLSVWPFMFY